MPEAVAGTIVGLVIVLIGAGAWKSAGREADRAGLAVLAGIAIPSLLVMAVLGSVRTGPAPVAVAVVTAMALALGALRPAIARRARPARPLSAVPATLTVVRADRPAASERRAA